jgi:regulator of protease activity HflC (stomatin/prohibitin superfamily)
MFSLRLFAIIPEKSVCIVERFGKFHTVLNSGFNFLVPVLDRIAYRHSLKEEAISIEKQHAITKVSLHLI